jgi:hypothetical protein
MIRHISHASVGLLIWGADSGTGAIDAASRLERRQGQPGASRHRAERTRERVRSFAVFLSRFSKVWGAFRDDEKTVTHIFGRNNPGAGGRSAFLPVYSALDRFWGLTGFRDMA